MLKFQLTRPVNGPSKGLWVRQRQHRSGDDVDNPRVVRVHVDVDWRVRDETPTHRLFDATGTTCCYTLIKKKVIE